MAMALETRRRYLSLSGAADYTSMSQSSLRRLIRTGELTGFRPAGAGKILVDAHELDALLRRSAGRPSARGHHLHAATDAAK